MSHEGQMYVVVKGCGKARGNGDPPVSVVPSVAANQQQIFLACALHPNDGNGHGKSATMEVTVKPSGLPNCLCTAAAGCMWARDNSIYSNVWVNLPQAHALNN